MSEEPRSLEDTIEEGVDLLIELHIVTKEIRDLLISIDKRLSTLEWMGGGKKP